MHIGFTNFSKGSVLLCTIEDTLVLTFNLFPTLRVIFFPIKVQNPAYTLKLIPHDRAYFSEVILSSPEKCLTDKTRKKRLKKKYKTLSSNARMQVVAVASKQSNLLKKPTLIHAVASL